MDYSSSPGGMNFGGLYFGPNKYEEAALSFFGPAVKNEEGRYFAYKKHHDHEPDRDRLVDVTETIPAIEGLNNFFFWFPVRPTALKRGDLFVVAGPEPLFYFVKKLNLYGNIDVLDPQTLTSTTYVIPDNLLRFQFVNKAFSLVSGNGIGGAGGDIDDTLLLLTLLNKDMENNALTTIFLLQALGLGDELSPFTGRGLGKRTHGLREFLPLLLLSGQQSGSSNALLPFLLAENLEEEARAPGTEYGGRPEETRRPEHGGGSEETRRPEYRDRP